MLISEEIAKALRIKRAKLAMTKKDVAKHLNVSDMTYRRLETGNWEVRNTVYKKVMNWLVEDYE